MKLKSLFYSLLILLLIMSCNKATEPTENPTNNDVHPVVGSMFTFDEYDTDTTSGDTISSSKMTYSYLVMQTNQSIAGKSNVSSFKTVGDPDTFLFHLNYENNGDFSTFLPSDTTGIVGFWITWPTASKTTINAVISDRVVQIGGFEAHVVSKVSTEYLGAETFTVKGESLSLSKVKQTMTTTTTMSGVERSTSYSQYLWYAPSLGFFARSESPVSADLVGRKTFGARTFLVDYTLK